MVPDTNRGIPTVSESPELGQFEAKARQSFDPGPRGLGIVGMDLNENEHMRYRGTSIEMEDVMML